MPLQETSGTASYDAFGGGVAVLPKYIEDYFSTFLYSGTGANQTITNGIDLATKGGLVWLKDRSQAYDHGLFDTARGAGYRVISNSTAAENFSLNYVSSFNNNGFSIGSPSSSTNYNGDNYTSWSFAKAPKFFDVVTYTGTGSYGTINHNLGSTPGMIIYKCTSQANNWCVYHRSISPTNALFLNRNVAQDASPDYFGSQSATSTQFPVGGNDLTNSNGQTYVAYLFAHNAGGFGLTGTDNVISCGSYTGNGSATGTVVDLGYEPQWVMVKRATVSTGSWEMYDSMRGFTMTADAVLRADTSGAEFSLQRINPTSTGFQLADSDGDVNASGSTYIYIAIRRGPMKVPTDGTKVFSPIASSATTGTIQTTGFAVDMQIQAYRPGGIPSIQRFVDRLRGVSTSSTETGAYLLSTSTNAEVNTTSTTRYWNNTGFQQPSAWDGSSTIFWNFGRAPSFFDEVCYTYTSYTGINHNLGVVPELIIQKRRDAVGAWYVTVFPANSYGLLQRTDAFSAAGQTQPTSTQFWPDYGAGTVVAYLFATCAGVSKVTSFTGNGSTQTINCGFTSGARFVLIKATSTTGNWLCFDTARGMTTSTDPWLALNSTAAESATTGACTTTSVGFSVDESKLTGVNTNGVSYIALAVA